MKQSNSAIVQAVLNNNLDKFIDLKSECNLNDAIHGFILPQSATSFFPLATNNLTLLHIAAYADSLEIFIYLTQECKIPLTIQSVDGYFPIHYACLGSSYEVVSFILSIDSSQASVYPKVKFHPLFLAVTVGSAEILKKLLDHGADLRRAENRSSNLIAQAIKFRYIECLKLLLHSNSSLLRNSKTINAQHLTPLMLAIVQGHSQAVPLLLEYGEDPLEMNQDHQCALYFACYFQDFTSIKLICKRISKVPPIASHWGCISGDPEILQTLLDLGGDPNATDRFGNNSVYRLVDRLEPENVIIQMLEELYEAGLDLKARAKYTPLEVFCRSVYQPPHIIEWLFDHGSSFSDFSSLSDFLSKYPIPSNATPKLIAKWNEATKSQ